MARAKLTALAVEIHGKDPTPVYMFTVSIAGNSYGSAKDRPNHRPTLALWQPNSMI